MLSPTINTCFLGLASGLRAVIVADVDTGTDAVGVGTGTGAIGEDTGVTMGITDDTGAF